MVPASTGTSAVGFSSQDEAIVNQSHRKVIFSLLKSASATTEDLLQLLAFEEILARGHVKYPGLDILPWG